MTKRMTADDLYQLRGLLEQMRVDPDAPDWVSAPINQVLAVSSVMLDINAPQHAAG